MDEKEQKIYNSYGITAMVLIFIYIILMSVNLIVIDNNKFLFKVGILFVGMALVCFGIRVGMRISCGEKVRSIDRLAEIYIIVFLLLNIIAIMEFV